MDDAQYKKEYDEAMAKLDEAAQATTSRAPNGQFTQAEQPPAEVVKEPIPEEPKAEAVETPAEETKPAVPDPLEELRVKLEKAEKALKDTQAWGTKSAQALADLKLKQELQQREVSRPQILEQNPELEQAIRHVVTDPTQKIQQEQHQRQWMQIIESAHPGIFAAGIDPELEAVLVKRRDESNGAWTDPLVAIRDITAEKLAHTERQISKKFQVEAEQRAKKSAMTVPGAGASTARVAPDSTADEVKRIQNMSPAEFERERRRVLGY